jgi:hypothetical protein
LPCRGHAHCLQEINHKEGTNIKAHLKKRKVLGCWGPHTKRKLKYGKEHCLLVERSPKATS